MGLLASCDDDDDNDYSGVITNELAGKYKGTLSITVDGQTVSTGNLQQVTVERGANSSSITLSLSDFSFSNLEIGDVSIENCVLVENGSSYTFSGTTSLSVSILTADVNATGVIGNGSLSIDMEIDALLGGVEQAVTVIYSGTKLSGTEGTEADIVSFTFDEDVVATQPVINGTTITFNVLEGVDVTSLTPTIEVSAGATITPASGVAQNFSSPVTYTVVSEDYGTTKTYTVSVNGTSIYYDFESWTPYQEGSESGFYNPTGWCSSNEGALYLMAFGGLADSYVVMETSDAYSGEKAALVTSIDTKGADMWIAKAPKVTTGSLFLGNFVVEITNTLNSTKFGIPFTQKPVSLKGWYKYTPGEEYYSVTEEPYVDHCHEAVLDSTKTDECMISVVLYETSEYDEENYSDCLTGVEGENNIYTPSRVVAIGQLTDGAQAEWTNFELPLEWRQEYDASKNYRLTIICSSSKDGDKFSGAPGSTLIVDEFELVCE